MAEVKVCCIANAEEAALAARAGARWLGLVGPMPSGPGILGHDAARAIVRAAPQGARPILLTASESAAAVAADAAAAGVDAVQAVRHIAPAEAAALAVLPLHYIQVVHVEGEEALDLIAPYAAYADAFLLDSGRPAAGVLGGTGARHDWSISKAFVAASPRPVFLAGGLSPGNAAEALEAVRPHGLDICSGLRQAGRLDAVLLSAFMDAVRSGEGADPIDGGPYPEPALSASGGPSVGGDRS
ncbi:MAG: phosphoribosylanthranilate isomerase [Pseudomonadota bacterium]